MKILFICKHNRFRSKVAEAIFNSLNKTPKNRAGSAGTNLDYAHPYIEENVIRLMKEKGYHLQNSKPRKLTQKLIKKSGLIIITADNVSKDSFSNLNKRIEKWDIKDCDGSDISSIKKRIQEIEIKVKELIKRSINNKI